MEESLKSPQKYGSVWSKLFLSCQILKNDSNICLSTCQNINFLLRQLFCRVHPLSIKCAWNFYVVNLRGNFQTRFLKNQCMLEKSCFNKKLIFWQVLLLILVTFFRIWEDKKILLHKQTYFWHFLPLQWNFKIAISPEKEFFRF